MQSQKNANQCVIAFEVFKFLVLEKTWIYNRHLCLNRDSIPDPELCSPVPLASTYSIFDSIVVAAAVVVVVSLASPQHILVSRAYEEAGHRLKLRTRINTQIQHHFLTKTNIHALTIRDSNPGPSIWDSSMLSTIQVSTIFRLL